MTDATETFLQTTRTSYDAIAKDYATQFPAGGRHPLDHSLITAFAELVTRGGTAPVADLGSGPAPECATHRGSDGGRAGAGGHAAAGAGRAGDAGAGVYPGPQPGGAA
ncbi:hypothetical protein [Streptomyces sp. NPDC046759]|uniref:hypothetical protein n=1 Tax=Streptomyces sp. NPDC046759 TaxID=3155019 RepID=UPI0033CD0567